MILCDIRNFRNDFLAKKRQKRNSIKTVFKCHFNAIPFYSKLNRFVLSPQKKLNRFVLKIRPGGFADYICHVVFHLSKNSFRFYTPPASMPDSFF